MKVVRIWSLQITNYRFDPNKYFRQLQVVHVKTDFRFLKIWHGHFQKSCLGEISK